jgi:hypothetical protein
MCRYGITDKGLGWFWMAKPQKRVPMRFFMRYGER